MHRIVRHLFLLMGLCALGLPQIGLARGDADLYRTVAAKVGNGESYYVAVDELHRQREYPTNPFYTVRTPYLAYLLAILGERMLAILASCVTLIVAVLWVRKLREHALAVRALAAWLVVAAGLPPAFSPYLVIHDYWSGLLISAALATRSPQARAAFGFAAAAVRELTMPFLGVLALLESRRRYAILALAAVSALLTVHSAMIIPGGTSSAGWLGLRGLGGVLTDLISVTGLQVLPRPVSVSLCILPTLGWAADRRALSWFGFFWLFTAIAARPDNTYWALNMLPAWFVGLALIPSSIVRLRQAFGRLTETHSPRKSEATGTSSTPRPPKSI